MEQEYVEYVSSELGNLVSEGDNSPKGGAGYTVPVVPVGFIDNLIRIAQWPNGQQKVITCKNCGAPVHNNVCEYCGTEY